MTKTLFARLGAALVLFGAFTGIAFAQGGGLPITLTNPLTGCSDLTCAATKVVGVLQTIGFSVAVIMVLVGAFQMMTSAGDPEKFSKGRKTILYAAIGVVVLIVAGGVVSIIQSLFK